MNFSDYNKQETHMQHTSLGSTHEKLEIFAPKVLSAAVCLAISGP